MAIRGLLADLAKHPLVTELTREYERRKAFVRLLKMNPCLDCGLQYHIVCMTFDHRDFRQKKGNISEFIMLHTFDELVAELEKCDLVCRNCHDIREFNRERKWKPIGRIKAYTGQWPKQYSSIHKLCLSFVYLLNRLFASRKMQRQILNALDAMRTENV